MKLIHPGDDKILLSSRQEVTVKRQLHTGRRVNLFVNGVHLASVSNCYDLEEERAVYVHTETRPYQAISVSQKNVGRFWTEFSERKNIPYIFQSILHTARLIVSIVAVEERDAHS